MGGWQPLDLLRRRMSGMWGLDEELQADLMRRADLLKRRSHRRGHGGGRGGGASTGESSSMGGELDEDP